MTKRDTIRMVVVKKPQRTGLHLFTDVMRTKPAGDGKVITLSATVHNRMRVLRETDLLAQLCKTRKETNSKTQLIMAEAFGCHL